MNTESFASLFPPHRAFAADVVFALALGQLSDDALAHRHCKRAIRRRLVWLEQARRVALDSDEPAARHPDACPLGPGCNCRGTYHQYPDDNRPNIYRL